MSDAHNDEFLADLIEDYGLEGYARWWLILEAIASQMDKTNKCSVTYSWTKWQSLLKGKRNKLETFLERLGNEQKIKTKLNGNKLEISCPKLLKLRDNYTKDLQASEQAPDPPPSKQEVEVEVEVDLKDLSPRAREDLLLGADYKSTRAELDNTFRDLTAIPGETSAPAVLVRPSTYPLTDDWQPHQAAVEWCCIGMGVDAALITPEAIFEFRNFWSDKAYCDSDRGWVGKLIGRIRDRAAKAPKPADDPQGFLEKHTDPGWREGLLDPPEVG